MQERHRRCASQQGYPVYYYLLKLGLETKRFPGGRFPAEHRYYYKVSRTIALGNDFVDWGGVSKSRMNP